MTAPEPRTDEDGRPQQTEIFSKAIFYGFPLGVVLAGMEIIFHIATGKW